MKNRLDPRARTGDDERDAAGNRRDADDGRQRNVVVFLGRRLDRTDIQNLLTRRVSNPADGEGGDSEHDQQHTDELHEHLHGPAEADAKDVLRCTERAR
jgi:hypothetical protein